ncbi:hypothetical protein BDV59DRAFT_49490 [Aspergillus ambiguus]|uniref:uncharacterized protein n=1 Tax=Aspergillus ambiguus TaxID=176160 RepID=UPI003CCD6DBF
MAPKYQFYNTTGKNLVQSRKSNIYYYQGDEALDRIVDIHFKGYDWVLLWSYVNESDNPYSQKVTQETTLRVKSGEEYAQEFKVSAEFSGMKVSAKAEAGFEHKTFTEEETVRSTKREETYKVKPHSTVRVYQKVYRFKVDYWFKLDAWATKWTVGNRGKDGALQVSSNITVLANEFIQTGEELKGTGTLEVEAVKRAAEQKNIKRLEDCTGRCQDYMRDNKISS